MNQRSRKRIYNRFCVMLAVLLSFSPATYAFAERIVFFTPTSQNNTYWPQVYEIVHKVAEDLNIQIEIYEFDVGDRFAKHLEGTNILEQQPQPDAAVFSVAFGNSKPLLDTAEKLHIPVFIQGPIFPTELPSLGKTPRALYSQWIGYFFQDEYQKGYLLAKTLLAKAHRRSSSSESITVAGIGGDATWFGSKLRQDGLLAAIAEDPKAELLQIIPTQWTEKEAMQKTSMLLHRYPKIDIIWAASDQLGIGAAKAIAQEVPNNRQKPLTGGLDLSDNGLEHVMKDDLSATVASTMIQYAEVFIYLYDYLHGIDFAEELSTELSSPLYIATNDNAKQFLTLINQLSKIDFRPYSKHLNPGLKKYDFSYERLLKSVEK